MRQVAVLAALAGLFSLSSAGYFCWTTNKPPCACPPGNWCEKTCDDPNTVVYCTCGRGCVCTCLTQMTAFNTSTTPEVDVTVPTKKFLDRMDMSPVSLSQDEYISVKQSTNTDALKESPRSFVTSHIPSNRRQDTVILEAESNHAEKKLNNEVASSTQSSNAEGFSSTRVFTTNSPTTQTINSLPTQTNGYCHGELKCPADNSGNCLCFWTDKTDDGSEALRFDVATLASSQPLVARTEGGNKLNLWQTVPYAGIPSGLVLDPTELTKKLIFRRESLDHMCPGSTAAVCEGDPTHEFKCYCKKPEDAKEKPKDDDSKTTKEESKTESSATSSTSETPTESKTTSSTETIKEVTVDATTTTTTRKKSKSVISYAPHQISILDSIYGVPHPIDPTASPIAGNPAPAPPEAPANPTSNTNKWTDRHEVHTWEQFTEPNPKTVTRESWQESILMSMKTHTTSEGYTDRFWRGVTMRKYTPTKYITLSEPPSGRRRRAEETGRVGEKRDRQMEVEEVKVMTVSGVLDEALEENAE